MGFKIVTVSILFIFSLLSGISFAQNKVVVIPLNDSLSDGELRAICRGYDFAGEKPPSKYKCPPKLVFVTASSDYTGNLGGVEGADAKCMQQASLSEITRGKMFKAWISDASNCPANSFIRSQTPYVRTCDRYVIATDWTDLVDGSSLLFIPSCDQYGGAVVPPHITKFAYWSYTGPDGRPIGDDQNCWEWEEEHAHGSGSVGTVQWVSGCLQCWTEAWTTTCNQYKRLLCVEQ